MKRTLPKAYLLPGILLALAVLLLAFFFLAPVFRVKTIRMSTTHLMSQGEVLELSGIRYGQHFLTKLVGPGFFEGRYKGAETRIKKAWPKLAEVEVRWRFPSQVEIYIKERIPIVYLDNKDSAVSLDSEGVVYEIVDHCPDKIPLVKGLRILRMEVGKPIEVDVKEDLMRCIDILNLIVEADMDQDGLPLLAQIKDIRTHDYQRVMLSLDLGAELRVLCAPNDYLKGHFLWLSQIIHEDAFLKQLPGRLELSGKHQIFTPEAQVEEEAEEVLETEAAPSYTVINLSPKEETP